MLVAVVVWDFEVGLWVGVWEVEQVVVGWLVGVGVGLFVCSLHHF